MVTKIPLNFWQLLLYSTWILCVHFYFIIQVLNFQVYSVIPVASDGTLTLAGGGGGGVRYLNYFLHGMCSLRSKTPTQI